MRIMLIEDDAETAHYLSQGLSAGGHSVSIVGNGIEGRDRAISEKWELLIVDRMLPGLDGLSIVKELRQAGTLTPVLFLTTLDGIDDRVRGLNAGADDYLIKPFSFEELLARVSALGRRSAGKMMGISLTIADLEVDLLARSVKRGGICIELLPREFRLLEYLMRHAGQTVTRAMLLENVWGVHFEPHTTVVETHLSRLRGKIDRGPWEPLIHTLRGTGYTIRAPL